MGVVYRAHDERLERDVALKVLPPGVLVDDSARKRFRKEALALSRLNHPNIATVFDFVTQEGTDFLVTELVEGVTLDNKLAAGPLPEKEVILTGVQMAEGLVAAHREGVIHRDLKPGNLRLTPEGRLKVLDFGLAKRVDPADQSTVTQSFSEQRGPAGTLAYMAPEQLRGEKVDARADLWAAGVVLYELATGRRPFEGQTATALADEILHAAAPSPQILQPKLPARLTDVILKCLEKDPENRYQSAKELMVDLRRLSMPTATATATQYLGWLNWRMRRRYQTLLVSAASILAAVLIMVWFSGRNPALAFAARDFVLISDFENQTGDPVFDKSLTTAFTTSLGQSSYANVYSRRRISEALKRMKKPAVDRIDEPLAQEIAVREGLKVIVLPSISGVGENYRVAASIRDVASGKDVKSEFVKANGKDKVLDAVAETADKAVNRSGSGLRLLRKWIEEMKEVGAEITAESVDILFIDPSLAHCQNRLTIKPSHPSCY